MLASINLRAAVTITSDAWTPIAWRPRSILNGVLRWTELPHAGIKLRDAQALAAEGKLLMANRHKDDMVLLVVKRPVQPVTENL